MRILRHPLEITDYQLVDLPNDGDLLSVAQSRSNPNFEVDLWSLDYEYGPGKTVALYVVGTGNPMPTELRDSAYIRDRKEQRRSHPGVVFDYGVGMDDPMPWRKFLGTVVTPNGLVWHVFGGPVR
jgi:hypothetical protein